MRNVLYKSTAFLLAASIAMAPALAQNQSLAKDASSYTFRVNSDLVLVNVVVRDKRGAFVRDLKRDDFVIQEDGKAQQIQSFDMENPDAGPATEQTQTTLQGETTAPKIMASRNAPNEVVRDKRLIVLFFDLSAMEPEEVDRCVKSANDFVNKQMTAADLVSVITLGDSMQVVQDFTTDHDLLKRAIATLNGDTSQGFQASDTTS